MLALVLKLENQKKKTLSVYEFYVRVVVVK